MKFAHLADCHIGGWREEKLKDLTIQAFSNAVDKIIEENVGFVIIAGDLFNTALPNIDLIKEAADILRRFKEKEIEVYLVPGSHDYSYSGKTMLDVFEKSGLIHNVMKLNDNKLEFTEDKTGVKITGMMGKRGGLDKHDYEKLDKENLESEEGFKIFLFHALLSELKTKDMEKIFSMEISSLPRNFNYYAGGHPHFVKVVDYDKGKLAYTGPLFPNSFDELEELGNGGFYVVDDKLNVKRIEVKLKDVLKFKFNADNKSVKELEEEIIYEILSKDIKGKIVLIRIDGVLSSGKPSDLDIKGILSRLNEAYVVLRNTNKFSSKEFEEVEIEHGDIEDIENNVIKEHLGQIKIYDFDKIKEQDFVKNLIHFLDKEKMENETNFDFENRIILELKKIL
nr:DNA repair exonuclease [Candidatus Woesearchaeota archaeon]